MNYSKFNIIKIDNEYDEKETSTKLLQQNKTLVLGKFAGVGKSTLVKNAFKENRDDVLFITPSNRLAYEYLDEDFLSYTAHMLLRIGIDNDFLKEMKHLDLTGIKTICFDEYMCFNLKVRQQIEYYMKKHTEFNYVATADVRQLKAPKVSDKEFKYLSDKLHLSFPNVIILEKIKRIESEEDKVLLEKLFDMIFDYSYEWNEERKRYILSCFESIEFGDITCDRTLCYKHVTEALVNAKIVQAKGGIKVGDIILCKEKYVNKKQNILCQRNYEYTVIKVDTGFLTIENKLQRRILQRKINRCTDDQEKGILKNELNSIAFSITRFTFQNFFRLNYALCVHSSQGLSISGEGVICDVLFEHSTREWTYVSISRFRKLKGNIKICWDNKPLYIKNFDEKIKGHKEEDLKKFKFIDHSKYVNLEWFMSQLQKQMYRCYSDGCSCLLELDYEDGSHNAYSIDRMDSSKPHYKESCAILCVQCNRTKKDDDHKIEY